MGTMELKDVERLVDAADASVRESLAVASKRTDGGKGIDGEQVHGERLAYAATEVRAARELLAYAKASKAERADAVLDAMTAAFAGEVLLRAVTQIDAHPDEFGLAPERIAATVGAPEVKKAARAATSDAAWQAIGRHVIEQRGANHSWIGDEIAAMTRDSVRQFAESEVLPHAERIHRHDELVPEEFIRKMSELGFFGMSVPEEFGGQGMGNLPMILTTEELSRCSLAAAGSLITRPEILTKALLKGGTEAQKKKWLPPIAAGEIMLWL
jgi:(2S)-methylsuccinyl-CoA dehydrogenase